MVMVMVNVVVMDDYFKNNGTLVRIVGIPPMVVASQALALAIIVMTDGRAVIDGIPNHPNVVSPRGVNGIIVGTLMIVHGRIVILGVEVMIHQIGVVDGVNGKTHRQNGMMMIGINQVGAVDGVEVEVEVEVDGANLVGVEVEVVVDGVMMIGGEALKPSQL